MARKLSEYESACFGYRVTAVIGRVIVGTAFLFGKIACREMSVSTNVAPRFSGLNHSTPCFLNGQHTPDCKSWRLFPRTQL